MKAQGTVNWNVARKIPKARKSVGVGKINIWRCLSFQLVLAS